MKNRSHNKEVSANGHKPCLLSAQKGGKPLFKISKLNNERKGGLPRQLIKMIRDASAKAAEEFEQQTPEQRFLHYLAGHFEVGHFERQVMKREKTERVKKKSKNSLGNCLGDKETKEIGGENDKV